MKTALVLLALLASACSTPRFKVMPRYGQFNASGDFGASSGGNVLTNSLGDAGIDDDNGYLGARADFKWGGPHLIATVQDTDQSGTGTLTQDIDIGGTTISAGATVDTTFDLGLYDLLFVFDLLPTDMFELGLGAGVKGVQIDGKFEEVGTGTTIKTDELIPVPVLAANGSVRFGRLEAAALLSGSSVSYSGDNVDVFDVDAYGRLRLFGGDDHLRASLVLGYRRFDIHADYEDGSDNIALDATFDGPYLGFEFSF
jgi:hypothetical protein